VIVAHTPKLVESACRRVSYNVREQVVEILAIINKKGIEKAGALRPGPCGMKEAAFTAGSSAPS
jgi:hypothetical protein